MARIGSDLATITYITYITFITAKRTRSGSERC
jgi:hypothetical protein